MPAASSDAVDDVHATRRGDLVVRVRVRHEKTARYVTSSKVNKCIDSFIGLPMPGLASKLVLLT